MELQIKDLVDSIKKDGIDTANKEAERIISEAKQKADDILKKAKDDAASIFENEKKEIEILRQSASVSAQQAKRDAVLSFKNEIEEMVKHLLNVKVGKVLASDALVSLICTAIKGEDVSKLNVETAGVTDSLKAELAEEIKKGLEIKLVKDMDKGFRITAKDGSGYFDCSDEEITEMLAPFFGDMTI